MERASILISRRSVVNDVLSRVLVRLSVYPVECRRGHAPTTSEPRPPTGANSFLYCAECRLQLTETGELTKGERDRGKTEPTVPFLVTHFRHGAQFDACRQPNSGSFPRKSSNDYSAEGEGSTRLRFGDDVGQS